MLSGFFLVLIAGAVVAFSTQNIDTLAVRFLIWRFDISVSTITIAAVLAGIVIAQLLRAVLAKRHEQTRKTVEFISRRRI